MSKGHYRAEIDGLRAVAVIGVVLFHLELGFPGGFVGVDVFFVISGFLITGILKRALQEERFSLRDFWARRVRRIAPAALVMVGVTLLLAGCLQTPERFASLASSAMAHSLLAANYYFSRDAGYFAESSDLEPLLHTWSLALEEQFYLLFPLIMLLIWKRSQAGTIWFFSGVALLSFLWACWELPHDPEEAFFLLPGRTWELLAGGILAMLPSLRLGGPTREVLSSIGFTLVLLPMFLFDRSTPFPGPAAVPPVLGAAMIILGGGSTRTGRILSRKILVNVGLISYSLYLWHWPLLVFAREVNLELNFKWKCSLLLASFAMAYLSWRWVETPFRKGGFLKGKTQALVFGAASSLILVCIALSIKLSGGLPKRYPPELRLIIEDIEWNGAEFTSAESVAVPIGAEHSGPIDFILWGDSHGASASPAVDHSARQLGLKGRAYVNNGTPPVTGLWFADMDHESAQEMTAMNERVLQEIIAERPALLILVGRWVARCEGYSQVEMIGERPSHHFATMVVDSMLSEPEFTDSASALLRQLKHMHRRLAAHGISLAILQQVPESTTTSNARLFYMRKRFPYLDSLAQFTTSPHAHAARQKRTMDSLAQLSGNGLSIIDPSPQFFREGKGLKIYAERSYYRDDDHLTRPGSLHYLSPIFHQLFSQHPQAQPR